MKALIYRSKLVVAMSIVSIGAQSHGVHGQAVPPGSTYTMEMNAIVKVPIESDAVVSYPGSFDAQTDHEREVEQHARAAAAYRQRMQLEEASLAAQGSPAEYLRQQRRYADYLIDDEFAESGLVLDTHRELLEHYLEQEDLASAKQIATRAWEYAQRTLGERHWRTIDAGLDVDRVKKLADANQETIARYHSLLHLSHDYGADLAALGDGQHSAQAHFGGAAPIRIDLLHQLSDRLPAEAGERKLAVLQEAESASLETYGSNHPRHAFACLKVADRHEQDGRGDEALACLLHTMEVLQDSDSGWWSARDIGYRLSDVDRRLQAYADRYRQQGDFGNAAQLQQRISDFYGERFGRKSWQRKVSEILRRKTLRLAQLTPAERRQLADTERLERDAANRFSRDLNGYAETIARAIDTYREVIPFDVIQQSNQHQQVASRFAAAGQDEDALAHYERAIRVLLPEFQRSHYPLLNKLVQDYITVADRLVSQLAGAGSNDRLQAALDAQIELLSSTLGLAHWKVASLKRSRSEFSKWSALSDEQKNEVASAKRLATTLHAMAQQEPGTTALASPQSAETATSVRTLVTQAERTAEKLDRLLGPNDTRNLELKTQLAEAWTQQGHFDRAVKTYEEVLDLYREGDGELQPNYVQTLRALAEVHFESGNDEQADQLQFKADAIGQLIGQSFEYRMEARTRTITLTSSSNERLSQLRQLLKSMTDVGSYLAALPIVRETSHIAKDLFGEQDREVAVSDANRASILTHLGDYAQAEKLFQQANDVFANAALPADMDYARNLHNLAVLYENQRRDAEALPLVDQALQVLAEPDVSPSVEHAQALTTKGSILLGLGRNDEAAECYQQAWGLLESNDAASGQVFLDTLDGLGFTEIARGNFQRAEELIQLARDGRLAQFGDGHEDFAESTFHLAILSELTGQLSEASLLYRSALEMTWLNLESASLAQTHRQQVAAAAAFRRRLDGYLAFTGRTPSTSVDETYALILRWKGAAFTRRQQLINAIDNDEIRAALAELDSVTSRLAQLAFEARWASDANRVREEIVALMDQQVTIEQRLSESFRQFRQDDPPMVTATQIIDALPDDAALVDIVEYRDVSWGPSGSGDRNAQARLAAFILDSSGSIERVDLGPSEPVMTSVSDWRSNFGLASEMTNDPAGDELRRLIWDPIAPRLPSGYIFVAPDGPLTMFPFAALPGDQAGTYLVEQRAIAMVPVPQAFPGQVVEPPLRSAGDESLLVVGNIDYFGERATVDSIAARSLATPSSPVENEFRNWDPLAGTRAEMYFLRGLFEELFLEGTCQILSGRRATERLVRSSAPAHRWLHIATHGFFAESLRRGLVADDDADTASVRDRWNLALFHPEVLSGVALAGANVSAGTTGDDDGLLTALEVPQLELTDVDMIVLSACQTGLGDFRAGEGLLGLQRSFHMAGARSVVASLWKVNDRATQQLIEDFYVNVWDKELPKIEALQQAQISMLRQGASRGLDDPIEDDQPSDPNRRLPPYYWAAFVLSGDWR